MPRTGTFCLTCNTAVTDAGSALSVAETHSVRKGKPIVGIIVGAIGLVLIGGLCYGLFQASRPHTATNIEYTVSQGLGLLVKAEGGTKGPCTKLSKYVEGPKTNYLPACQAMINQDPGAHLTATKVSNVVLHGHSGTAHVHATLVDDKGTHTIDRDVKVHEKNVWHLVWDRQPLM